MTNQQHEAQTLAATAEKIVSECLEGQITVLELPQKLRDLGLTPEAAGDYVEQVESRVRELSATGGRGGGERPQREPTPPRQASPTIATSESQLAEFRKQREEDERKNREERDGRYQKALEEAAWARIISKAKDIATSRPSDTEQSSGLSVALAELLGTGDSTPGKSKGEISTTLLGIAPHLGALTSGTGDAHVNKTVELRSAFATESSESIDRIITALQLSERDGDPIARPQWKDILQDKLLDFEKLHAAMESGYSHGEDAKDIVADGWALVRKEQFNKRRPIVTESNWDRVFNTWAEATTMVYVHRKDELKAYKRIVKEMFQAFPSKPAIAIRFDADVRDRYSKRPFRLDDRSHLQISTLSHLVQASSAASTLPLAKRISPSTSGRATKRQATDCVNWNKYQCSTDPCPWDRIHGKCCECGGNHRAWDVAECKAAVEARGREEATSGAGASRGRGGRRH